MVNTRQNKQITRNQHYVPQFYLRKFVNKDKRVETLDLKLKKIIKPKSTKTICSNIFYYGRETGKIDEISQMMEKIFQTYEDSLSKNLNKIIKKILDHDQIQEDEKWTIAFLMSMIWISSPIMRTQINDLQEKVSKKINLVKFCQDNIDGWFDKYDKKTRRETSKETRAKIKDIIIRGDYNIKFDNSQHLMMVKDIKGYANLFWDQDWIVYITKSKRKFITSDNPVAVFIPEMKGPYGPGFLERTHMFPLTPEICIKTRYPQKETGKKFKRITLFEEKREQALSINKAILSRATKYVLSNNTRDLEELKNIIDSN